MKNLLKILIVFSFFVFCFYSCSFKLKFESAHLSQFKDSLDKRTDLTIENKYSLLKGEIDLLYMKHRIKK